MPIYLPPLRERTGDVLALFWHFVRIQNEESRLRHIASITVDVRDAIANYAWPGNVRELQSAVEYMFVVGEGEVADVGDLPPEVRGERPEDSTRVRLRGKDEAGRTRILEALERNRWKRGPTARELGMSRSTLWRKLREFDLKSKSD